MVVYICQCYSLNSTQCVEKQRHTLLTEVRIVKAMVMYGDESWTVKQAEYQRIDAFKLWCWGRPLRVPWTARGSNQSILREVNPEYSLEVLGEAHRLKPPMLARHHSNHLHELAKDNPEANPITIKPETESHVAELFFWVPLPCCSPPGCSFPIKSLALSAHVSPWTIHFGVLDKSPVSGPVEGVLPSTTV